MGDVDEVKKLKIPYGEFLAIDEETRAAYLTDMLERALQSPVKRGIGRFETLLSPFGLNGEVESDLRKTLFEMQQVRNVLVHKLGVVDSKFRRDCPWFDVPEGAVLQVSAEMAHRYSHAVGDYLVVLINRVRARYDLNESNRSEQTGEPPPGGEPKYAAARRV